jgi:hypothetical protein
MFESSIGRSVDKFKKNDLVLIHRQNLIVISYTLKIINKLIGIIRLTSVKRSYKNLHFGYRAVLKKSSK